MYRNRKKSKRQKSLRKRRWEREGCRNRDGAAAVVSFLDKGAFTLAAQTGTAFSSISCLLRAESCFRRECH